MTRLKVTDLSVRFETSRGTVRAVDGVSFALEPAECLGIVGESGSGKSQILLALMGLLPGNALRTGTIEIGGAQPAIVFQDPLTSLNPYLPIGLQVAEALVPRRTLRAARAQVIAILKRLRIADPEARLRQYPHQLSGGMRQRVMIAMALIREPEILLADEPTTALDVTVQADILDLFAAERDQHRRSLILVTHDLGVVARLCDRVLVMYAGKIVEQASIDDLFAHPRHPYTRALLAAVPRPDDAADRELVTIAGSPPDLSEMIQGCAFAPRCGKRLDICSHVAPVPSELGSGHHASCHLLSP